VNGPYETGREAHAAAVAAIPPHVAGSILTAEQNRQLLTQACESTGVALGAFDRRIIDWLAGYEDSTCGVIAGLITRAHAAGQDTAGGPGTAQPGGGWISGPST
jgi:hypothetical protein